MSIANLSPAQLRKAADLQETISSLQTQLAVLLGGEAKAIQPATKPVKKKGGMSAAGRAKVAAAQKARWAKIKAAKAKPTAKVAIKPVKKARKQMSAEAKAKIAAAAKARWAKIKAAKK
jgi:hypothetical protein